MVESAIEFADICRSLDYHNFVFSMKASNPLVMVQAYRLLAAEQYRLGWDYPIHLGVTEAGEGEDGRMKSAIGIGSLLADGLGDTIRVSLTEDPEYEYAPCNRLAEIGTARHSDDSARASQAAVTTYEDSRDVFSFAKRVGELPGQEDGDEFDYRGLLNRDGSVLQPVPLSMLSEPQALYKALGCKTVVGLPFKDIATTDAIVLRESPPLDSDVARQTLKRLMDVAVLPIVPAAELAARPIEGAVALATLAEVAAGAVPACAKRVVLSLDGSESEADVLALKETPHAFVLLDVADGLSRLHASRRLFTLFGAHGVDSAVIHHFRPPPSDSYEFALQLGSQVGGLLCDGLGDGVLVEPQEGSDFGIEYLRTTSFGLLQGSRMRNIKTEFVSCPSCGRTLFDLQEVTAQISSRTGHLPGVAIAIMGCIVNGPGEMADADFGYVGGAPGKVDLYVGKEVVKRGIPNEEACDALIELIKDNGKWVEKEEEEAEADEVELATA